MKNLFIILFIFSILSAIAQKKKTYFDKSYNRGSNIWLRLYSSDAR